MEKEARLALPEGARTPRGGMTPLPPPLRLCIDRHLPRPYATSSKDLERDLRRAMRARSFGSTPHREWADYRLAVLRSRAWQPGMRLRCRFLDGSGTQRDRVMQIAPEWCEHANVDFDFVPAGDAEIRISFMADSSSWSAIGTDALVDKYFAPHQPTMNLGWLTDEESDEEYRRVVLHEFGHALGCVHEHSSPSADLRWNVEQVYGAFGGPPNFWSREQIDESILRTYAEQQVNASAFDPLSIMIYALPASLFHDHPEIPANHQLSPLDRELIRGMYPGRSERLRGRPVEPKSARLPGSVGLAVQAGHSKKVVISRADQNWELDRPDTATSQRWAYLVRNRRRWKRNSRAMAIACRDLLAGLQAGQSCLEAIRQGGRFEVRLDVRPDCDSTPDERVFPWEYVLSAAGLASREKPLTVIRRVVNARSTKRYGERPLLFVQSEPPDLAGYYSYHSEWCLVSRNFSSADGPLINPTISQLQTRLADWAPEVVHVTGVDAHQGRTILRSLGHRPADRYASPPNDGLWLDGGRGPVDAARVAQTLAGEAEAPPRIISCNFYNSAPRVASIAVLLGAGAAIGFQDSFDDTLAERFFANFYAKYQAGDTLVDSFEAALGNLPFEDIRGTGVVLWMADSFQESIARNPGPGAWGKEVEADIRVTHDLNYSRLHNREGLFQMFRVHQPDPDTPRTVDVRVQLHAGGASFPYRSRVLLDGRVTDLARGIHVPLTADLERSLQEHVRSSLYVSVRSGGRVIYRDTHPVTLLPIDEWRDSFNANWLPSFVLPRDPVVIRLVEMAQPFLQALRNDDGAGFDAYQALPPMVKHPQACEVVDAQVKALWWTIVGEAALSYINPPPTFTQESQRLRSPSSIMRGRSGTCLDLALLVAACLEYVGIDPVIFLLEGHALPGYWRHQHWKDEFQSMRRVLHGDLDLQPSEADLGDPGGEPDWYFPASSWKEIAEEVASGRLVPLESVGLTRHNSFKRANEDGLERLARGPFQSMVDIKSARADGVTPLPLPTLSEWNPLERPGR